jgi:ribosomal protein L32
MAVPKGRVSKSKRDKRKAQSWKIATPSLVKCSKCGELMVPHQVCKACGASFHVVNIPPKTEGICDNCGGELFQRADDTIETVENRIEVYNQQTMPLVDYYTAAGNIAVIDGALALDTVFDAIVEAIGE